MRKIWLGAAVLLLILAGCRKNEKVTPVKTTPVDPAGFSVASLFQSNMVLQRDKPATIWGNGPASIKVAVTLSWGPTVLNTTADAAGNWAVTIPASMATSIPQTISIKADGSNAITLSNVLIGDVWICSGQSNMVMPVDSIAPFTGVLNFRGEIAAANYPMVRMLNITEDSELAPITQLRNAVPWKVCSPSTVGAESAVAYYFAQKLNTTLNVPIGIIVSAVDGSWCQDWANVGAIEGNNILSAAYLSSCSSFYNGMINPLTGLSIKGFIWYQGENNQNDDPKSDYTLVNTALINGWRSMFNQGSLPFYYTQLTPFAQDFTTTTPPGGDTTQDNLGLFREAQANIRKVATGTGMAVTMDVGEAANHHPRNKKPVGERLALLALNNTYGQSVQSVGPQYASFSTNQYTVTVNFVAGTANGLGTINNAPLAQHFFVAGTDHVFRWASAKIVGSTIVITAPAATPLPVQAVRYAFTAAPITNLQNSAGLPAEPFRTDSYSF